MWLIFEFVEAEHSKKSDLVDFAKLFASSRLTTRISSKSDLFPTTKVIIFSGPLFSREAFQVFKASKEL